MFLLNCNLKKGLVCKKIQKELIRPINLVLWCASITLLGILLYGLYGDFNGHPLTREQHIWYQATFRILWSVGLSYIIFACLNSQGGRKFGSIFRISIYFHFFLTKTIKLRFH